MLTINHVNKERKSQSKFLNFVDFTKVYYYTIHIVENILTYFDQIQDLQKLIIPKIIMYILHFIFSDLANMTDWKCVG